MHIHMNEIVGLAVATEIFSLVLLGADQNVVISDHQKVFYY